MEKEIKEEELFIPKAKHKALKIILAIILIGALIAGGYFLYKEKFCNPNKTVISIIEDAEKELKNQINDTNIYKFNGVLKIDAKISDELKPITDIINNLDLQFIYESDAKNNLFNITLNGKYKKDQLIDINLYSDKQSMYILLQDVYDKYLKISLDDVVKEGNTDISNIDINEKIKVITNSFTKAIKNSLNNLEFKRTSTTIKIDDNDRNVYNNYVELKEDDIKKIMKDTVNTLSKDSDFIDLFKKMTGEDAKFEDLNDVIDKSTFPGKYILNFYTNKNIFNQKLVSIRLDIINDDDKTSINYDKISDDEELLLINTSGGTMQNRLKKTNSVYNINFSINVLGMKVKLDLSSNYEKIKEVTKPDVSDSKKIEELTSDEEKTIEEKLQNSKGMISLIQDIAKINQKNA